MGTSETVFPHLLTVSGVVCFVPAQYVLKCGQQQCRWMEVCTVELQPLGGSECCKKKYACWVLATIEVFLYERSNVGPLLLVQTKVSQQLLDELL